MGKKLYVVEITETLQKRFIIEAKDEAHAADIAHSNYKNCDFNYILDSENLVDTDIEVLGCVVKNEDVDN